MILSNFLDLKPELLNITEIMSCVYEIFCLLAHVPLVPTSTSLQMVTEICRLAVRCLSNNQNPEILDRITAHDHAIMASLGYLLDLKHYSN